eukprot:5187872-Lingulodinium_polyedra.AAC.1
MTTELTRSADTSEHRTAADGSASGPAAPVDIDMDMGSDAEEREFFGAEAAGSAGPSKAVHAAASRLESQLVQLVVEPTS